MENRFVPINKGNYSMDTVEREDAFEERRGRGWEEEYRLYRRRWTEYARTQTVAEYPLLVDLELASVCNLRCPMCYTISPAFKQKVNARLMDFALFTRIVDEIGGKVPALRLSLRGEATLHPRFAEAIAYAKARGIREVSSLTHGGRLEPDFVKAIVDAGLDWLTVSIDGVGETYEKIRKPITFAQILENVKNVRRYREARGLARPVVKVQGIWPAIRPDPQAYYDALAPWVDLVAFNPLIDYLGHDSDVRYVEDFACPQQYQRLVVGADGLVMKCSNDEENREVVGDANAQTVHEIWHGPALAAVREQQRRRRGFLESPVCRRCYLPRATESSEIVRLRTHGFPVENYVNRPQEIGK